MKRRSVCHQWGVVVGASAALIGLSSNASASGFEKGVFWSGKWGGVAGAAVSGADGAEALYFNPAGMAGKEGLEVSGNFSPILSKFSGPFNPNQSVDGNTSFSPAFGVMSKYGLSRDLSIGAGVYVGAGSKAVFQDVAFGAYTMRPTVQTNLYEVEASLGAAYQIIQGLKIGAAYRVSFINARFSSESTKDLGGGNVLLNFVDLQNLTKTKWNGFRLGAQYTSNDNRWGLGVTWRTPIDFIAKGTSSGQFETRNGTTLVSAFTGNYTGGDVSVASSLPSQISAGADYAIIPEKLRLLAQYTWTEYHRNQTLGIDGSVSAAALGGANAIPSVNLGWSNETRIAGGLICTEVPTWAFRAGYAWVSQVQPNNSALPQLVAPGAAHTITVGAGKQMSENLELDTAFEYDTASGTGEPNATLGDYSSKAYTLHFGATYRM
jgi:long-chain fatty acid transport protein